MSVKDISDRQVVEACIQKDLSGENVPDILASITGQPRKVCYRAIERAVKNGRVDYGTSVNRAFPTPEGLALLSAIDAARQP